MNYSNNLGLGSSSFKQIGQAADLRGQIPKGDPIRQQLNQIVHTEDPVNVQRYGRPGEYNDRAQIVIAQAQAMKKSGK